MTACCCGMTTSNRCSAAIAAVVADQSQARPAPKRAGLAVSLAKRSTSIHTWQNRARGSAENLMNGHASFDPFDLKGWFRDRIALVTGASSGMGHEMALALGRAGARVGVNFRSNRKSADELCQRIRHAGGQAVAIQADVCQPE